MEIYVFLYQNLNIREEPAENKFITIYVFLYQNLNSIMLSQFGEVSHNLCISILEFKCVMC